MSQVRWLFVLVSSCALLFTASPMALSQGLVTEKAISGDMA